MPRMSPSEYQTFLARTSPAAVCSGTVALTAAEHEADLHESIRQFCAAKGWLCFHGSMAHRTHRTAGEPDFQILIDSGKFLLVECKAAKTKVSTEQLGIIAWAKKLGHTIHIVRSIEEFKQIVDNI